MAMPRSACHGEIVLAELVEGNQRSRLLDVPEGPAVAGRRTLRGGADLVDRALLTAVPTDASASTVALQRRLASVSEVPGAIIPLSIRAPNGTLGWVARDAITCIALSSSASVESIRARATAM